MRRWAEAIRIYRDPRMIALFFLGLSSGLPRLLVYSTLSYWLLDEGLSIKAVGLFAATGLPYNFKFLWAPLVDRAPLPFLTRLLGQRRGWMLALQLAIVVSIALLASVDPGTDPMDAAFLAVVIATFSASQDIVIDAFRVEILEDDEQGAGAAAAVFGYRAGMLLAGAGALYLAAITGDWETTYLSMAGLMGIGVLTTLLVAEPLIERVDIPRRGGRLSFAVDHAREAVISPFRDFLTRRGAVLVMIFVVLYKIGDALAGTMTGPFLVSLHFTKMEIANIAKTYGLIASLVGVVAGGALVNKLGIMKALWIAGVLQMASNLMFWLQALIGHDSLMLAATIGVENLTGGLGTAAFVAYLSGLCNKHYTATQYALLTALSSILHTLAATGAGYAVEHVGWAHYFLATTAAALPGLALLLWLNMKGLTGMPTPRAVPSP